MRFGVSDQGRLKLFLTLEDQNDYATIEPIREEILDALNSLTERYASNPNTPQAGWFKPLTNRYLSHLSRDPREINYVALYAVGARFFAAGRLLKREVASGEWPASDPREEEAIDAICELQGPLIMASAAGRKLVVDANEYVATPETYERDEHAINDLTEALVREGDILDPQTAEDIMVMASHIPDDPQPHRSRGLRLILAGSLLVATVGTVGALSVLASGGPVVATGLAASAGMYAWEVLKKTAMFKSTTDAQAKSFDKSADGIEATMNSAVPQLFERVATFVKKQRTLVERVTELRAEFSWARKVVSKLVGRENMTSRTPTSQEQQTRDEENLPEVDRVNRAILTLVERHIANGEAIVSLPYPLMFEVNSPEGRICVAAITARKRARLARYKSIAKATNSRGDVLRLVIYIVFPKSKAEKTKHNHVSISKIFKEISSTSIVSGYVEESIGSPQFHIMSSEQFIA